MLQRSIPMSLAFNAFLLLIFSSFMIACNEQEVLPTDTLVDEESASLDEKEPTWLKIDDQTLQNVVAEVYEEGLMTQEEKQFLKEVDQYLITDFALEIPTLEQTKAYVTLFRDKENPDDIGRMMILRNADSIRYYQSILPETVALRYLAVFDAKDIKASHTSHNGRTSATSSFIVLPGIAIRSTPLFNVQYLTAYEVGLFLGINGDGLSGGGSPIAYMADWSPEQWNIFSAADIGHLTGDDYLSALEYLYLSMEDATEEELAMALIDPNVLKDLEKIQKEYAYLAFTGKICHDFFKKNLKDSRLHSTEVRATLMKDEN